MYQVWYYAATMYTAGLQNGQYNSSATVNRIHSVRLKCLYCIRYTINTGIEKCVFGRFVLMSFRAMAD